MTITKTDVIQAQTNSLAGCCQIDNISSGSSMEDLDDSNRSIGSANNNVDFCNTNLMDGGKYSFPKRDPVDVAFREVKFTAKLFSLTKCKFEQKEILHGVNGTFRSNELTAIMGPSGSGKTTLLNSLAGYITRGVDGIVKYNGEDRNHNKDKFSKNIAYIHQNDELRPWLTAGEQMTFAAHLKLGYGVSYEEKHKLVKKILFLLGLDKRYNTRTGCLSGGQKKRLAIALEMLSNPPILYLDEPTTGLDSSSTRQCISLLKRLAQQGRTVVATIHQPSALILEMFDQLYAVATGHCIYQGPVQELLPFLGSFGLNCPSYHNPADFLMEIAIGEYNIDLNKLIKVALKKYYENVGKSIEEECDNNSGPVYKDTTESNDASSPMYNGGALNGTRRYDLDGNGNDFWERNLQVMHEKKISPMKVVKYSTEGIFQFLILYQRYFLCSRRNSFLIVVRMIANVLTGILFGYIYGGVGSTGNTALGNYIYLYGSTLFVAYTGKMAVMLSFPMEIEVLSREHFNRWYGLLPYFLSVIAFEIPVQVISMIPYCIISYFLTGNLEAEEFRLLYFTSGCIFATLAAQAWGFLVGATLPIKPAVFIGPILLVLFSAFGFCMPYRDVTKLFKWMWHISFFRSAFHVNLISVYGYNRTDLPCPDDVLYCHFSKPKVFLQEMDIANVNMTENMTMVAGIIIVVHFCTLFALWYKLNKR